MKAPPSLPDLVAVGRTFGVDSKNEPAWMSRSFTEGGLIVRVPGEVLSRLMSEVEVMRRTMPDDLRPVTIALGRDACPWRGAHEAPGPAAYLGHNLAPLDGVTVAAYPPPALRETAAQGAKGASLSKTQKAELALRSKRKSANDWEFCVSGMCRTRDGEVISMSPVPLSEIRQTLIAEADSLPNAEDAPHRRTVAKAFVSPPAKHLILLAASLSDAAWKDLTDWRWADASADAPPAVDAEAAAPNETATFLDRAFVQAFGGHAFSAHADRALLSQIRQRLAEGFTDSFASMRWTQPLIASVAQQTAERLVTDWMLYEPLKSRLLDAGGLERLNALMESKHVAGDVNLVARFRTAVISLKAHQAATSASRPPVEIGHADTRQRMRL